METGVKRKEVLIFFLIISMLSNVGLVAFVAINLKDHNIEEVATSMNEMINEQPIDYESYLKSIFSPEELKMVGKKAWGYVFNVNGQVFKANTQYVSSNNISILFAEVLENTQIPKDIADMGKLDQPDQNIALLDYIKIYSEVEYEIQKEETDEGVKYYLNFKDVPNQSIITIQFSQEIRNRLHYENEVKEDRLVVIKR